MEWNIFGIMDGLLEKAKTKCWSNYKQILNEYTLFSEAEKTDREEATMDGVDMSNPSSLFGECVSVV